MGAGDVLRKQWFLVGLAGVIGMAAIYPSVGRKHGPLHPEATVKYMAVPIIFFFSGLTLKTKDLKSALGNIRVHVFIQSFSFLFAPLWLTCVASVLESNSLLMKSLASGVVAVGCMPPPVSSAVILTRTAGANDAVALFNSCLGSLLGVTITPMLLMLALGEKSDDTAGGVDTAQVITDLALTVLVPIVLGQVAHVQLYERLHIQTLPLSKVGSGLLLFIIYTTFCETFMRDIDISARDVVTLAAVVLALQLSLLAASYALVTSLSGVHAWADIVPVLFTTTHKSLTLGMPILKIIYADRPDVSILTLPICFWHATQLVLGSVLAPHLKQRVMAGAPLPT